MAFPAPAPAASAQPGYFRLLGERFDRVGTDTKYELGRGTNASSSFLSLGDSRQISRHHLTIQWSGDRWQCLIVGRNGVTIDRQWHKCNVTDGDSDGGGPLVVDLSSTQATPIKVGDVKLWFCPAMPAGVSGGKR